MRCQARVHELTLYGALVGILSLSLGSDLLSEHQKTSQ